MTANAKANANADAWNHLKNVHLVILLIKSIASCVKPCDQKDSASLQEAMEAKYDSVQAMVSSSDFIEGPKAFAEKRPPNWQGK